LKQLDLSVRRALLTTVFLASAMVFTTACVAAPGAGNGQPAAGSSEASASSAPQVVDYAALFNELPVVKGATRVRRTAEDLRYVVPGDHRETEMRALYKRELEKRGWRFYDQMGSVTVYEKGGAFVDVGRDWMNNGDLLVIISHP